VQRLGWKHAGEDLVSVQLYCWDVQQLGMQHAVETGTGYVQMHSVCCTLDHITASKRVRLYVLRKFLQLLADGALELLTS
jgi:hypothetical protein